MTLHRQWLRRAVLGGVWALALGANAQTNPIPAPVPVPTVPAPAPTTPAAPPAVAPAGPPPVDTDAQEIAAAYDQLNAAYVRGDLKAYFAWFAPDYQVTGTDGKTKDLSQVENQTHQQRGELTSFHSLWKLSPLTPADDGSGGESVLLTTHATGTGQKKVLFFTAKGSFVDDTQMRDLWVDTPQGWRLKRRQVLTDHLQSHPG